jgi:hypothetical protein
MLACVQSSFVVLAPPAQGGLRYTVKYQLGKAGSDFAYGEAKKARVAGQVAGFEMEFQGIDDGTGVLKCIKGAKISKFVIFHCYPDFHLSLAYKRQQC